MNKDMFIFLWQAINRGDGSVRYTTRCGSDSIKKIDGRWKVRTMIENAKEFAQKSGAVGYSVGYLTGHDPEEKHSQAIKSFTLV